MNNRLLRAAGEHRNLALQVVSSQCAPSYIDASLYNPKRDAIGGFPDVGGGAGCLRTDR